MCTELVGTQSLGQEVALSSFLLRIFMLWLAIWAFIFMAVKYEIFIVVSSAVMIHYLQNKVGVVDFANAQGLVMF